MKAWLTAFVMFLLTMAIVILLGTAAIMIVQSGL